MNGAHRGPKRRPSTRRAALGLLAGVACLVATAGYAASVDTVVVSGRVPGAELAVLIDGAARAPVASLGCRVGGGQESSSVTVTLPNLTSAAGRPNRVVAFSDRRVPALVAAGWTPQADTLSLDLGDREIGLPITIWIVHGDYYQQVGRAIRALVFAATLLRAERTGIRIASVELRDATGDEYREFRDFYCAHQKKQLYQLVDVQPGQRLHVFYVEKVDGDPTKGQACAERRVAVIGSRAEPDLLIHEIGHNFDLGHSWFGGRNPVPTYYNHSDVMTHGSSVREFFTEGQTFRAAFQPKSALNRLGLRPASLPRVFCTKPGQCPELQLRLWDDGACPTAIADCRPDMTVATTASLPCKTSQHPPQLQVARSLPLDLKELVEHVLLTDCEQDADPTLDERLRDKAASHQARETLRETLLEALLKPDADYANWFERRVKERSRRLLSAVADDVPGLPFIDVAAVFATIDANAKSRFAVAWNLRTIHALGVLNAVAPDPVARRKLEAVRDGNDPVLAPAAKRALEHDE